MESNVTKIAFKMLLEAISSVFLQEEAYAMRELCVWCLLASKLLIIGPGELASRWAWNPFQIQVVTSAYRGPVVRYEANLSSSRRNGWLTLHTHTRVVDRRLDTCKGRNRKKASQSTGSKKATHQEGPSTGVRLAQQGGGGGRATAATGENSYRARGSRLGKTNLG